MNVGSEGAQKLLQVHEEIADQRHRNDLLSVMSTPEGRRLVFDIIVRSGVFESSFANDALLGAFKEGQRSVGLHVFERVKAETPEQYLTALNEQIAEQRKNKELRDAAKAEAKKNEEENE